MLNELSSKLIDKKTESVPEKSESKITEEVPKTVILEKSAIPIGQQKKVSKFSIQQTLEKEETTEDVSKVVIPEKELPSNHFTNTDLQTEWNKFLENIKNKDIIIYSAISSFQFSKKDENTITINYPSDSAKKEFEKIQDEFLNHFRHKVNHFNITIDFQMNTSLKKEIVTKRKLFEKLVEINPLLKDLDDLMKFDLT